MKQFTRSGPNCQSVDRHSRKAKINWAQRLKWTPLVRDESHWQGSRRSSQCCYPCCIPVVWINKRLESPGQPDQLLTPTLALEKNVVWKAGLRHQREKAQNCYWKMHCKEICPGQGYECWSILDFHTKPPHFPIPFLAC